MILPRCDLNCLLSSLDLRCRKILVWKVGDTLGPYKRGEISLPLFHRNRWRRNLLFPHFPGCLRAVRSSSIKEHGGEKERERSIIDAFTCIAESGASLAVVVVRQYVYMCVFCSTDRRGTFFFSSWEFGNSRCAHKSPLSPSACGHTAQEGVATLTDIEKS